MNFDDKTLITALINIAAAAGWSLRSVFDGEQWNPACNRVETMALLGNIDEASLRFIRDVDGTRERGTVVCVLGSRDWTTLADASENFGEITTRAYEECAAYVA